MSTLAPVPSFKSALIAHLREQPLMLEVYAPERIVHRLRDVTGKPANWLVLVLAGGFEAHPDLPLMYPRLTAHCYGSNGYEALRGWRALKAVLEAPTRSGIGFVSNGCVFEDVRVGMPYETTEPGTDTWEKVVGTLNLTVKEIAHV